MTGRPAISLADVLSVGSTLRADATTLREIAGLLGVDLAAAGEPVAAPRPVSSSGAMPGRSGPPTAVPAPNQPAEATARTPSTEPPTTRSDHYTELTRRSVPVGAGPYVIPAVDVPMVMPPRLVVERLSGEEVPHAGASSRPDIALAETPQAGDPLPTEPEPLFPADRSRALLATLIGVAAAIGEVDVEAMVADAAGGDLVHERRRRRLTLRNGVQVLIDVGPGMTPYALDAAHLEREIRRLAGDGASILRFMGCPTGRAGAGSGPRPWRPYRPPAQPARVVAVSDLGLGRGGFHAGAEPPEAWLPFADLLDRARCPLVVLTPYPPSRLPPLLRRALRTVWWDERTPVAAVNHLVPSW